MNPKYISFIQIVKSSDMDVLPNQALQAWFRAKNTIEFLILWEEKFNPAFSRASSERLTQETAQRNATLTLKHWIANTGATVIVCLQGRYGGTYADLNIAKDFEMWLLPEARLRYLISIDYEMNRREK